MTPREIIPLEWTEQLGSGPLGLGHDIATTTKGTSNWSSLVVAEHAPPLYVERLVLRWKTASDEVSLDLLDCVVSDIENSGRRPRRLCVDASNEKYHAQRIRRHFAGRVPVDLVVAGERIDWRGEIYDYKTLLGSLYSAAYEDNVMACPDGPWLRDDRRLVTKEAGKFVAQLGTDGGHGDTFDGGKLALWGVTTSGTWSPGDIQAAPTSDQWGGAPDRPGIKNPHAHLFRPTSTLKA